jgi:hypothetical protein
VAFGEFLSTRTGKIVGFTVIGVGLLLLIYSGWNLVRDSRVAANSGDRVFVCSEAGKTFEGRLAIGDMTPIDSPHSGKKTGYPADELCYWTTDGKTKDEPTYILMNRTLHKKGPTVCPDCNRLVVRDNPRPGPESKPPPTREEYAKLGNRKPARDDVPAE